jgi:murein DD-endopeptidase MepM/ murein hydrolase activator NlpD
MVSRGDKTIFATLAGTVSFSGYAEDGFGLRVYVRSGEFLAIYPHLSRALVATGQAVVWGQPVGIEGSSGYSTGSHLHYQLEVNGHWVDPVPYLYRE